MKFNLQYKIDPRFGLSSMTDLVFLLLIFFMLGVSSVIPQVLPIDLPVSNYADAVLPQVNVVITKDLSYYVDSQSVAQEQLGTVLRQTLHGAQDLILLQVDKSVPVAHLIYVTDIATSLDARVAMATQPGP